MVMPLAANPYPAGDVAAAVARALARANDHPQPVADADRTAEKYARLAQNFRSSAWRHLGEGDLPQASNKAWGLVAETIKAVSAQHGGIIHDDYHTIQKVLRELARVADNAGDADARQWLNNSFTIARVLHSNFYQDECDLDEIRAGLRMCEQLAERLLALFGPVDAPDVDLTAPVPYHHPQPRRFLPMTTPLAATPYPAGDVAAAVTRALDKAKDRPQPAVDANRSAEKYARLAQNFRNSAWRHLGEGDLPQASNKAWGLVAETVKAVSAQHGGFIHSHGAIWTTVRELAQLAGNAGDPATQQWLQSSFSVARGLHANFYEDEAPLADVRADLQRCELLAERLLALFGPVGTV